MSEEIRRVEDIYIKVEGWRVTPRGGRKGGEMNGWHRHIELKT